VGKDPETNTQWSENILPGSGDLPGKIFLSYGFECGKADKLNDAKSG
jgi:hypothetical protein